VAKNFMLVVEDVEDMSQLHRLLSSMHGFVFTAAVNA
jgi:hypothetical protein